MNKLISPPGLTNVPGIYHIINKTTGIKYYGQSKKLRRRMLGHIVALETGQRCNKFLKEAFDNGDLLVFEVLKTLPFATKQELRNNEEELIKGDIKCYNVLFNSSRVAKNHIPDMSKPRQGRTPLFTLDQINSIFLDIRPATVVCLEYECSSSYISHIRRGRRCIRELSQLGHI